MQQARDETAEQFARDPDPILSGREIVDGELLAMEVASVNRVLDQTPNKVDDYRHGTAMQQQVAREYMQTPKVPRDMRTH